MNTHYTMEMLNGLFALCERIVGRGLPRPIELTVLNSIADALEDQARELLDRQASLINHWHRFGNSRMIVPLWRPKLHPKRIPSESLFPFRPIDRLVPLARTKLCANVVQGMITCDSYLFEGQIARLYFSDSIDTRLKSERDPIEWQVTTEIVTDPMSKWTLQHLSSDDRAKVLRIRDMDGLETEVILSSNPLPNPLRHRLSQFYGGRLPDEFLDWCKLAEGFSSGACRVLGLLELNRYVTSDHDYYVLATTGTAGELVVRLGEPRTIYYLDYERLSLEVTQDSLLRCISNASQNQDYYRRALG